jgi:hypothetical protein
MLQSFRFSRSISILVFQTCLFLTRILRRYAEEQSRLDEFLDIFTYEGNSTCAADGMCQVKCPVVGGCAQVESS